MEWTVESGRNVASVWPHPIFTLLRLQLLFSSRYNLYSSLPLWNVSYIYGSDSRCFSSDALFIPFLEVILLALLSKPPHSRTWKTRKKRHRQGVKKCCWRVTPRSNFPWFLAPQVACWWYSWHRWWLTRTCRYTERQHFLEDKFKSWMT